MRRPVLLLILLSLALGACGNAADVEGVRGDESVRFTNVYQPTPPVCENEDERHVEEFDRVVCIWRCKGFWTALRGAGRYDVARTWRWHEGNQQYEPTTIGTDAQWHEACDALPVTGCPSCVGEEG